MHKTFKQYAEEILEKHNCKLIEMLSETRILWKNPKGTIFSDDFFIINTMSDSAWAFWCEQ